jgi:hypothetical protein
MNLAGEWFVKFIQHSTTIGPYMSKNQWDKFHFRNLHPQVLIGTASDRYAGWIGQIYSQDRYTGRISQRSSER